jgi:hypothetical protein
MHTVLNPSNPNHEWFEELCALAAIGELAAAEFHDLQEHLAACPHCRQLYADFCRISADDIGLVAIQGRAEESDEDSPGPLDEQELLGRVLSRTREQAVDAPRVSSAARIGDHSIRFSGVSMWQWLQRPTLAYGVLALLLAAGAGAYRFRDLQQNKRLTDLESRLAFWKDRAETRATEQSSAAKLLEQSQLEREALQKAQEEARIQYADLMTQQKTLQSAVAAANARAEQLGNDLNVAKATQQAQEGLTGELQAKLERATERVQEQQQLVADLRRKVERAEAAAIAPAAPPVEDAEAKGLFGARDLHIVDVYDVEGNGKTRRTFGRVYYVEKKLLVFYAFDLKDKRHNRTAAGFQAWGYREASSSKPANLGLFYVDDASLDRWVLKVNNPRVLEHIDAVFVTLEPPDGSPSPQGRRLLYANLSGPPNHP